MNTHRRSLVALAALAGLAALASPAPAPRAEGAGRACRCAPRTLAEYFEAADEVFIGRLVGSHEQETRRLLRFDLSEAPYKGGGGTPGSYQTGLTSASCGLPVETGAVYVVFAEQGWLSTCNGSRILRSVDGTLHGFDDVPGRFVVSQLTALAALAELAAVSAHEPRRDALDGTRLVGLLDVAPFAHGGNVTLRRAPDADAEIIAMVESMAELDHRESGYEVDAAVVHGSVDGWHRLRRVDGVFGWVPAATGTFFPYDELPVRRLAYLNEHWGGFVWPELGAGQPWRISGGWPPAEGRAEQPVEVVGSRRIAGSLWFQVEVLRSDGCNGEPAPTLAAGWVPAYGGSGNPAVWFHSRGC